MSRLIATYRIRSTAQEIEHRAQTIAVEQSVEMPVEIIDNQDVLDNVVGQVGNIQDLGDGTFKTDLHLASSTTGPEPGQLMNMLFGNTSIHDDVTLEDVRFPSDVVEVLPGPNHGIQGLRSRCGANHRAMTCSALKPQGSSPEALADLAYRMALGGIDFIKDDHGLADQRYSPYAERVKACASRVHDANEKTGGSTRYIPSLSGNLDALRGQVRLAKEYSLSAVLIAPMIVGIPSLVALVREFPDMAFMAHPAMAGASRISPPLLLGKLFRLFGADATIFPNHGGRFGYSPEICRSLADNARSEFENRKPCIPVPAGGMTLDRVSEMLSFYGPDTMLLIGGGLLAAREQLTAQTEAFAKQVASQTN